MASLHPHNSLLLPLLLITILFLINIDPARSVQALIDKICQQTEDYGFCVRSFSERVDPVTANITGLTLATIELATDNATVTHNYVSGLLKGTTDPTLKNYLTVCENAYRVVMQSFDDALLAFNSGDYRSMLNDEAGTPRAAASCVTIFETPPKRDPPPLLNERNREMRILIIMAVVTANIINIAG